MELLVLIAAAVVPAPAAPPPQPSKLVCKKQDMTGSRLSARRVCKTQSEWNQDARNAAKWLNDQQNKTTLISNQ